VPDTVDSAIRVPRTATRRELRVDAHRRWLREREELQETGFPAGGAARRVQSRLGGDDAVERERAEDLRTDLGLESVQRVERGQDLRRRDVDVAVAGHAGEVRGDVGSLTSSERLLVVDLGSRAAGVGRRARSDHRHHGHDQDRDGRHHEAPTDGGGSAASR
jgi:hypothetical protein